MARKARERSPFRMSVPAPRQARRSAGALALLAAIAGTAAPAWAGPNLLTNPGFETGDLTGWTLSLNPSASTYSQVTTAFGTCYAGSYCYYTKTGDATLSQTVSTTAGDLVTIGGYVEGITAAETFSILFDGATILTASPTLSTWTLESAAAVSTGTDTIAFDFNTSSGGGAFMIDSTFATATRVPEPMTLLLLATGLLGAGITRRRSGAA